eukprot:m.603479 g.603479  ORF g.603479 m.603479 type:complete len:367 (+) comp22454_c1_seq2:243-1343(+)
MAGVAARREELQAEAVKLQASIFEARKALLDNTLVNVCEDVEQIQSLRFKRRTKLKRHSGKIYDTHWSTDSRHLVSAGQEGSLIVWDAWRGQKEQAIRLESPWVMACAYAPSGNAVASGGLDNMCSIFSLEARQTDASSKTVLKGHSGFISQCRFRGDTEMITSSGDGGLWLWDIGKRAATTKLLGHEADVTAFGVKDHNVLVSCSVDKTCKVWDLRIGQCVSTLQGHGSDINCLTMHPCGEAFATGSHDGSARLWDLRADQQIEHYCRDVDDDSAMQDDCHAIAFSHSGRLLFVSTSERIDETQPVTSPPINNILIWDSLSGDLFLDRKLNSKGARNRVTSMEVSRDGVALCTAGWEGKISCWHA